MSILLDALKKSEQERHLGQTPTLQSHPNEPLQGGKSLNQWIILAMVVVSVSVMTWFGWQQFRMPIESTEAVVVAQTGEVQAGVDETPAQNRTLTESYQADRPEPAKPATDPGGQLENEPGTRDRLSRSVSTYTAEDDPPVLEESTQGLAANVEVEPEPEPVDDSSPVEVQTTPEEQEPGRRQGLEPHVAEPISYWELPQGVRDNLPVIKITVLVYAERPADRFLLSNGQRLVEKDQLDGGVVLDEIRKDGAVFLFRNYRFLVKS